MRHTRAHTRNRRSHHSIDEKGLSVCGDCGASKENHKVCMTCGKYKGNQVIDVEAKAAKKLAKAKARGEEPSE